LYKLHQRYPRLADFLDGVSSIILANLLWILVSVPIVTLPAATAGLFGAMAPLARGQTSVLLYDFFGAVRRRWMPSTAVFVLDLAIGALFYTNLSITAALETPLAWLTQIAVLIGAVVALMANLYAWPLLVSFDMPLRSVLSTSLRLALGHLFWSIFIVILALLPLVLALFIPVLLVVGAFSASSVLASWGAWRVIRRYVSEEELAGLEPPEDAPTDTWRRLG
jgi:uncharacterized membrane protein YesL